MTGRDGRQRFLLFPSASIYITSQIKHLFFLSCLKIHWHNLGFSIFLGMFLSMVQVRVLTILIGINQMSISPLQVHLPITPPLRAASPPSFAPATNPIGPPTAPPSKAPVRGNKANFILDACIKTRYCENPSEIRFPTLT